jgi:polysaccharide biosynthesis transport protein
MDRGEDLMAEPEAEPTLRVYLQILRKRRWWVAALTMLGLTVSLALSLTQQKQYSASAQLLVQATGGINLALGSGQYSVTPTDVQTELQLVTSAHVQELVRKKLGSAPPVSAAEIGQTNVIAVTAVDPDPARAALVANAYARAFVSSSTAATISNLAAAENQLAGQIRALGKEINHLKSGSASQMAALSNQQAVLKGQLAQLQVAGTVASTGLEFVTPALVPTSPSSPKPRQDALLGLLAGLVLGVGAAFLRDSLDDTLTTSETAEQVNGAPVLATVPMVASWKKIENPVMVAVSDPTSPAAEAYRSLRTSLQFSRQERTLRTLLVTSSHAREGKTATVANLGAVFAQAGERVVLVSCDLRRPRLSQSSAPADAPELSAVLAGELSLDEALTPVAGVEGLWSLSTRSVVPNPTEMLSSPRARELFAELAERFDLALIDSPPVLPVADAMILTSYADGVLIVVASGQTRRTELQRTTEKLAQANAPIVGMVLNKVSAESGYGRYGRYGRYGSYGSYSYSPSTPSRGDNGQGMSTSSPLLSSSTPGGPEN